MTGEKRQIGVYWVVITLLLLLCLARGISTVRGLNLPGDIDSFRDIGYVQGFLDGNFLGDTHYLGEFRFYPPLEHAGAAIVAWLAGLSPMILWLQASPFLNLLAPLAFAEMCRRLFDLQTAVACIAVFVLVNGFTGAPWVAGGYTPWPFVSNLALPLFFAGVALIYGRIDDLRLGSSVLIGLIIGLSFLAHPWPGILLATIFTVTSFYYNGFGGKSLSRVGVAALPALALSLLVLGPLVIQYHLHARNLAPGSWLDPALDLTLAQLNAGKLILFVFNVLGFLAGSVLFVYRQRLSQADKKNTAILLAWVSTCSILILRHTFCSWTELSVCRISIVPIHHAHLYLQAAWSCILGVALSSLAQRGSSWLSSFNLSCEMRRVVTVTSIAVISIVTVELIYRFLHRGYDLAARQVAAGERGIDMKAYRWMLENTRPDDLFVTEETDLDKPSTVIASGRKLVSLPLYFSNPYVNWDERDQRRKLYLNALRDPHQSLCSLRNESSATREAWFFVGNDMPVVSPRVKAAYRTEFNTVYRVTESCERKTGIP